MQHEDRALVEGELAESLLQLVSVGDRLDVVHATRDVGVKHTNGRCPSSVSRCIRVTGVNKNPEGPSLKLVGVPQVRELPPDRQQGVLQHVLGERGISEDPPGDAQERVTDLVHQLCERFLVAGAGSLHHISVHQTSGEVVIRPRSTKGEGSDHRNRSVPPYALGWLGGGLHAA